MANGKAIDDIASILGKEVDAKKLQGISTSILSQNKLLGDAITNLSNDEKTVLVQYLGLYNIMKTNQQQYQQAINGFLQQSVLGNGQIMLFGLN